MPTPRAIGLSPSPFNQRRSASLTWTTDTSLNAIGPPSSKTQPNNSPAGVGGPSRWSHDWQQGWSHPTGKTSGYLDPCGWQTTQSLLGGGRRLQRLVGVAVALVGG